MAAQDALGIGIVLRVAPAAQDQSGFDNVAGVVGLAATAMICTGHFDGPADLVAHLPQSVVEENPNPLYEASIPGEVGQLGQGREDAGSGVGVGAKKFG